MNAWSRRAALAVAALWGISSAAAAQAPVWSGYAEDPQHTSVSAFASDNLTTIAWQTTLDQQPLYSGNGDLLIHYGSPLITAADTVVVPVKLSATGSNASGGNFLVEGLNGASGQTLWSQTTDYVLPPHDWTPVYSPALTPSNGLYYGGAGGTVYFRANVNSASAPTPTQFAFYGLATYNANPSAYNSSVFIDTPITSDSAGDIFFGYQVVSNPNNLVLSSLGTGGIARISSTGVGTWVTAFTASGDPSMIKAVQNNAPALSNDGSTLYIAVNSNNNPGYYGGGPGYVLALSSTTLATIGQVQPIDPVSHSASPLADDSTASVTVGPDGSVYFGVLDNAGTSRGWLMHYSANLATTMTPGGFGWDDTASIVPASMIPTALYHGSSSYLLMVKYNNYFETGGGGQNMIAILDPTAAVTDNLRNNSTGAQIMQPILEMLGVTPDTTAGAPAGALREWCINNAVVDPATDSVLVTSEDGSLYRWNLGTDTFTQILSLSSALGEAYTPTLIGPTGTVFALNNGVLFAVVPEPGTLTLAGIGAAIGLCVVWKRRKLGAGRVRRGNTISIFKFESST